jgi:hypothetical protein
VFWLAVAALLAAHAFLLMDQARSNAPAFDEIIYAPAGYKILTSGRDNLNPEHPPMLKLLLGASWLGAGVSSTGIEANVHPFTIGQQMLYDGPTPARRLLLRARLVVVTLSLATAVLIFLFARRLAGATAGLAALGFYALDPLVLGHASLATLDVGAASFFFAAACAIGWGVSRGLLGALGAGLALGVALSSKLSTLPLLVGVAGTMLWALRRATPGVSKRAVAQTITMLSVAAAVVFCLPGGRTGFLHALSLQREHAQLGHMTFALGQLSQHGWWWYYPVAWALKTPLPSLGWTLAGAFVLVAEATRQPRLLLPHVLSMAGFTLLTLFAAVAIGLRNMLPIVPILCVGAGLAVSRVWNSSPRWRWLPLILFLWLAVGTWRIHPCELSFMNEAAGGTRAAANLLSDSNVDWGTDLGRVAPIINQQPLRRLYLVYFGSARPSEYGLPRYQWMPAYNFAPRLSLDGPDPQGREWIAISATALTGVYPPGPDAYAWLNDRQPTARAGASILLFDITGDSDAHGRLGFAALQAHFVEPAVAALERAIQLSPKDHNVVTALVAAYRSHGDNTAAEHLCATSPELVPAWLCLPPSEAKR